MLLRLWELIQLVLRFDLMDITNQLKNHLFRLAFNRFTFLCLFPSLLCLCIVYVCIIVKEVMSLPGFDS